MPIFLLSLFIFVSTATNVGGQLQGRIVAGNEVQDRCKAPYNAMVALRAILDDATPVVCSAVMIDSQHLVTAGHCIESYSFYNLSIHALVGELDLYGTEPYERNMVIAKGDTKLHAGFNASTGDDNIGLIRLPRKAQLNRCVQPAMPITADPNVASDDDENCKMVGWGPYNEGALANSRLPREASIQVLGELATRITFLLQFGTLQPKGHVLAEPLRSTQRACVFDRGGIVSCNRNGNQQLRGIIADSNCNTVGYSPLLVVDVPAYQSWIDDCLRNWDSCRATTY